MLVGFFLRKAKDMIEADAASKSASIEVDFKNGRFIRVNGSIAFRQAKSDVQGSFSGSFSHLS